MTRNRLSTLTALVGLATGVVSVLGAPAAGAAAPTKVGWWSAAALDELVVPATTSDGELRIGAAAGQVTAFAAMLFRADATAGVLRLTVASVTGTPAVVACPASADTWTAGGNQAMSTAPGYDCTVARYPGELSKDGATLSFPVSSFGQVNQGELDFVVVPDSSAAVPPTFSLEFRAPTGRALTITARTSALEPTAAAPTAAPRPTHTSVGVPARGSTADVRAGQPVPQRSLAVGPTSSDAAPVVAPSTTAVAATAATAAAYPPLNKAGLAVAVLLLALAGWLRFLPVPKG